MKFNEFPYQRPDCNELFAVIDKVVANFENANSFDEQLALYKELDKAFSKVMTLASIANVRNTINTKDEFYQAEREYIDSVSPLIQEKGQAVQALIYNSKFKDDFRKTLGDVYFLNLDLALKSFSPEVVALSQEENLLTAQYQKLYASAAVEFDGKTLPLPLLGPYKQSTDRAVRKAAYEAEGKFFDEHQAEFDDLFDKLVKNRTEQAKVLGFNNFVELGYARRSRNCYGPKEVANYRNQIIDEIVPLVGKIKKAQQERIGVEDFKFYDDSFTFKNGNATPKGTPDELLAAAKVMYSEMSPETKEFIEVMFEHDLFDVLSRDGKAPGGYCTSFDDYGVPFIFSNFNGTAGDVDVLTHEAGHAFAFYTSMKEIEYSDVRQPSMEGCEVHSMAMEYLTGPWHNLFFKEDTNKYTIAHTEDGLSFLPYGTMVDYFQELVYSHPDMSAAERNQTWANLEKQFRPYLDFDNLPFYGRGAGWQRQLHIYLYPFYYIDYCMASTVALQIHALHIENPEKAWETYMTYTKMGGTKTFVELVRSAGLIAPIDDNCLKNVCNVIGKWLFKLEA